MSLQLRIHLPQGRSTNYRGNSRTILRTSKPPDSPLLDKNVCDALDADGRQCEALLASEGLPWCKRHLKERRELNAQWLRLQREADEMEVFSPATAQRKVMKLHVAVNLRRQIRDRFFPRGGDTVDYLKWITKLEKDIRSLADSHLMSHVAGQSSSDILRVAPLSPYHESSRPFERIMVLRSPMDPRIPTSGLDDLPDDRTILVLKQFYTGLCQERIRRLYNLVPDLEDGPLHRSPEPEGRRKRPVLHDDGAEIIRAWFRIMILNDSEADALELATRSKNINDYLHGCHPSRLEVYLDFFEKAWRKHSLQLLKVAICTHILTGSKEKVNYIELLGGTIPSTTEGSKMTKPCWDVLYQWFPALLTPWTLASICSSFEDYATLCKLLILGMYREYWFDRSNVITTCSVGVFLGFIPSGKGEFSSTANILKVEGEVVQTESRNYIIGQMSIADGLARHFLDELRQRTARLHLVVYEGSNAHITVHSSDKDLFISRRRVAKSVDDLEQADWTTEITLEGIKNDLRLRKESLYDPIVADSWQFIIIDREPGLPFQLFDIVQDVLLMLVGDLSPRDVAKRVIKEVIPSSDQGVFLDEMSIESSIEMRSPVPPEVQYEGNRQRCFDPDRGKIHKYHAKMAGEARSRDANRFIRRVLDDMERAGIISLAPEYEPPQTKPVIIQGTDGGLDLYFPYDFGLLSPDPESTPSLTLPPPTCLLDFANEFKRKYPGAIMAKGSIMTHYCAWPMPAVKRLGKKRLNFGTWEGHVYHWNAMPFDRPWSDRAWQYYLQHYMNSKYPFVFFYLTTFVLCAVDKADAERAALTILEEAERRNWRVILRDWTDDVEDLGLDVVFNGIRPT